MNTKELKILQIEALKSGDVFEINKINKQLYEIAREKAKQKQKEREIRKDNRTAERIEKYCELHKGM